MRILPLFAALLLPASVLPSRTHASSSAPLPPPICSSLPPDSQTPCIPAPNIDPGNPNATGPFPAPLLFDTPAIDFVPDAGGDPPEVSFSIVDFGQAPVGTSLRPPAWYGYATFYPTDLVGTAITLWIKNTSDCRGALTCAYQYLTFGRPAPGWYIAHTFGYQEACPPSANGVYGCVANNVGAAVYVPPANDLDPPKVRLATARAGHQVKAVAIGRDPYGLSLSLEWDFGDGTPPQAGSFGTVVGHTYPDWGKYTVTARATATDGRYASRGVNVDVTPPPATLRGIGRVSPPLGDGTVAMAAGDAPGWPAGSIVTVRYWENGCPLDPTSNEALNASLGARIGALADDGTFTVPFPILYFTADAAVVQVQAYTQTNGVPRAYEATSACIPIGAAGLTTADATAGDVELAVPSDTVPIGHVALIGAGAADAESHVVTGHGSLIFATGLGHAHPAGAVVLDLGVPPGPPFTEPPPPADPDLPPDFGATTTSTTTTGSTSTTSTTTTIGNSTTTTTAPGCTVAVTGASIACRLDAVIALVGADTTIYKQRQPLLAKLAAARSTLDAATASTNVRARKRLLNAMAAKLQSATKLARKRSVPSTVRAVMTAVGPLAADVRALRATPP